MVGLGDHQELQVKALLAESADSIMQELTRRDARIERLELQLRDLQTRANHIDTVNQELFFLNRLMKRRVDDLDQYSRRLNIIIGGMPIRPKESPDSIRRSIISDITKLGLGIQDFEVSRAHRHGQPHFNQYGDKVQDCIIRFISWRARDIYYQARKQSDFFLAPDLTPRRAEIFKHAKYRLEEVSVSNVFDYICVDKNCRLTAKAGSNFYGFSSKFEFETLISWVEARISKDQKDIIYGHDQYGQHNMERMSFLDPVMLSNP